MRLHSLNGRMWWSRLRFPARALCAEHGALSQFWMMTFSGNGTT
jgi:hypothetical protein